jgi:DNA-binding transcriptional ArsR family regulator
MVAEEDALPLDQTLIKVLASDTRMDILRLLKQRRMTMTEIARGLSLQKATILEHLDKLQQADLVRRVEDERLWVYYELTRRGKRIVNPGPTRILLLLGWTAAACVVAVALLLAFQSFAPAPVPPASSGDDRPFLLTSAEALGGGSVRLQAQAPPGEVAAFLVPRDSRGDQGYALQVHRATPTQATLTADGVPPGEYVLLLRTAHGVAEPAPHVRIPAAQGGMAEAAWWQGVSGDAIAHATVDGAPAEGSIDLVPRRADGGAALRADLAEGIATFTAARLDALRPGPFEVRLVTANGTAPLGAFEVHAPAVVVAPRDLLAGEPTLVRITVPGNTTVAFHGASAIPRGLEGTTRPYEVVAGAPGEVRVQVGRLTLPLQVHPNLPLRATAQQIAGEVRILLSVAQADRAPAAGVAVLLDGRPQGFTDANGTLAIAPPAPGERNLTLLTPQGHAVHRTLQAQGWNLTLAPAQVRAEARAANASAGEARVAVALANPAATPRAVTVLGLVGGTPVAAERVLLGANGTAQATLHAALASGPTAIEVRALSLPASPFAFEDRVPRPPPPQASNTTGNGTGGVGTGTGTGTATGTGTGSGTSAPSVRLDGPLLLGAVQVQVESLALRPTDPRTANLEPLGELRSPLSQKEAARTPAPDPGLALLATLGAALLAARRRQR